MIVIVLINNNVALTRINILILNYLLQDYKRFSLRKVLKKDH